MDRFLLLKKQKLRFSKKRIQRNKSDYLKAGATNGTQIALMATATPPIPAATKK